MLKLYCSAQCLAVHSNVYYQCCITVDLHVHVTFEFMEEIVKKKFEHPCIVYGGNAVSYPGIVSIHTIHSNNQK